MAVSSAARLVAGIQLTVYGLDELSPSQPAACLWLFHGRLSSQQAMQPVAARCIDAWNSQNKHGQAKGKGLIAVSFDQRNHGGRTVDAEANQDWAGGNESHAADMFGIYHGTALDTSLLIDHLAVALFPHSPARIVQHLALGVSLGGHVAWLLLLHEPRITAAISVIGCADYTRLMADRARRKGRASYSQAGEDGSGFVGSSDFPPALVETVDRWDPAGVLLRPLREKKGLNGYSSLRDVEGCEGELGELLDKHLRGKTILILGGEEDELVPSAMSAPLIRYLKDASGETGWWRDRGVEVAEQSYAGVGHAFSEQMVERAVGFVCEQVSRGDLSISL
ncbi:hypothetical protein FQN53_002403 [Emmonsiellopsis sp. PD_33]|nr:hypothetical protein FQN53_002403 [Emmonsiellopsis sp. PD_33]